jgi:hypothetical protein
VTDPNRLPGPTGTTSLGVIVGPTRFASPRANQIVHCLDLLDLDAGDAEPARIKLDFFAHGFALNPSRPHEAALLEKRGPGACYVDLVKRTVLRRIEPLAGHHFYGHGAFSRDGSQLFAVETNLATKDGALSVRDPISFAVVDTFPTYGKAPHDCHLIEDGATLAITNGGGPLGTSHMPCVTFVDVASRKLLEKVETTNPRVNAGHVALTAGRAFALVSAPRDGLPGETELGGVAVRPRGGPLAHLVEPKSVTSRMLGEALSVCVHEQTGIVLATHPYGHLVSCWDLRTGRPITAFGLPDARGVTLTLDRRFFVIAFGPAASHLLLDASTLRPLADRPPGARMFGGSHIYTWSKPS